MRPIPLLLLLTALVAASAGAQDQARVLRIRPFGGEALQPGEAAALQNLVTSYVVELRAFRVIDSDGQELALREAETAMQLGVPKDIAPLAADYLLSAQAGRAGGLIVFTMDLTKVSTGEKRSVAETAASVNDLVLASRRLTRSLFDRVEPAAAAPAAYSPPSGQVVTREGNAPGTAAQGAARAAIDPAPSLARVSGTWKGDRGVDRVTLFADGRGVAILSSGASMRVRTLVQGSMVIVGQDQSSLPEFYRSPGLDLKAARAVAAKARPWKWTFYLSTDGAGLAGIKESVFVKVDTKGEVTVDNNYIRDAAWTRMYR
jgi:hypothetical protein